MRLSNIFIVCCYIRKALRFLLQVPLRESSYFGVLVELFDGVMLNIVRLPQLLGFLSLICDVLISSILGKTPIGFSGL